MNLVLQYMTNEPLNVNLGTPKDFPEFVEGYYGFPLDYNKLLEGDFGPWKGNLELPKGGKEYGLGHIKAIKGMWAE